MPRSARKPFPPRQLTIPAGWFPMESCAVHSVGPSPGEFQHSGCPDLQDNITVGAKMFAFPRAINPFIGFANAYKPNKHHNPKRLSILFGWRFIIAINHCTQILFIFAASVLCYTYAIRFSSIRPWLIKSKHMQAVCAQIHSPSPQTVRQTVGFVGGRLKSYWNFTYSCLWHFHHPIWLRSMCSADFVIRLHVRFGRDKWTSIQSYQIGLIRFQYDKILNIIM